MKSKKIRLYGGRKPYPTGLLRPGSDEALFCLDVNTSRSSCGTLNYNKGIVELLWAWPEVLRQVRSAQLHVFGKFGQWIDPQGTKFNGFDKILAANELVFAECIERFIKAGGDPGMVCGEKNRNASE